MANEQSIDEIISQAAFDQIEKLKVDLKATNQQFIDTVKSVTVLNEAIANAKTFSQFTKAATESSIAVEKINKAAQLTQQQADKTAALQAKYADDQAKRDQVKQAAADKEIVKQAEITAAVDKKTKTVISDSQAEIDAYNKVETAANGVINAQNRISAGQSNSSAAISGQPQAPVSSGPAPVSDLSSQEKALQSYIRTSVQLKVQIDELKAAQKSLDAEFKDGSITAGQFADRSVTLATNLSSLNTALVENNAQVKAQSQVVSSTKGSYTDLQAQLNLLIISYKSLSEAEQKSAQGKELQSQILALTNKLKELDKGLGISTRSVGEYEKAVKGLKGSFVSFIPGAGALNASIEQGRGIFANIVAVVMGYAGSLSLVRANQAAASAATKEYTAAVLEADEAVAASVAAAAIAAQADRILATATAAVTDAKFSELVAVNAATEGQIAFAAGTITATEAERLQAVAEAARTATLAAQTELELVNIDVKTAKTTATLTAADAERALATATTLQTTSQEAQTIATETGTVAMRAFRVALLSTGIGAIIVLLGSLIIYFNQTNEGAKRIKVGLAELSAVMQELFKTIAPIGKAFSDAFSSGQGNGIKIITATLRNLLIPLGTLFRVISDLKNGNFTAAFNDINTGIKEFAKNNVEGAKAVVGFSVDLVTGLGKASDQIKKNGTDFAGAAKSAGDLTRERFALTKAEREYAAERIKQVGIATVLASKSRQQTLSEEERIAAAEKAKAIRADIFKNDLAFANKNAELIQREQALNSKKDFQAIADSKNRVQQVIADHNIQIQSIENRESRLQAKLGAANKKTALENTLANLDSQQAIVQANADAQKAIAADESKSLDLRLAALKNYLLLSENVDAIQAQKKVARAKGNAKQIQAATDEQATADKKVAIEVEALKTALNKKATAELKKQLDEGLKLVTQQEKDQIQVIQDSNNEKLEDIELFRAKAIEGVNKNYAQGLINEEQYNEQIRNIELSAAQARIKTQIDTVSAIIAIQKGFLQFGIGTNKQLGDDEKALAALRIKYSALSTDDAIKKAQKVADAKKVINDKEKDLAKELLSFTTATFDATFTKQQNAVQDQIDLNKTKTDKEIQAVNDSTDSAQVKADKIAVINAKAASQEALLERKKRDIQIRQAKFDKASAITGVILNIALAQTKTLATTGFLGLPLLPVIAAIGALQIATILAQPIPKFEKGGTKRGDGIAMFGEVGTELMIDPSGSLSLTPSTPTLGYVKSGTEFISNKDLVNMLGTGVKPDRIDVSDVANEIKKGNSKLILALKSSRNPVVKQSKRGFMKDNDAITSMNNYLKRNF